MQQGDAEVEWIEALGRPLDVGAVRLANRLMMSALTLQWGNNGCFSDRHLAFYRERAEGGVGLLFSEQLIASPVSGSPFTQALSAYESRQIESLRLITTMLDAYESKFFAQLFCAGAAGLSTVGLDHWAPLRGPSGIAAPDGESPAPLTQDDIRKIVADHAQSAENVIAGGVHGIEIHGAHGWLVGQFLSPYYNRRVDQYGGTTENRCRFAIEIARSIRAVAGPRVPLGISLTYDELLGAAGITEDDTLRQLRVLDATGLFDFFDLSLASSHQQHFTIASMAVPQGITLPFAARARRIIRAQTKILTSGRITDVKMAGRAVLEGQADVIGMSRALLADPHLFRKARASSPKTITRCIGSNFCVARALVDQPVACVVNPRTGREASWPLLQRARRSQVIRVIGAGPAGLRFARTAAQSGHRVSLYEKRPEVGGHLARLALLPSRESWSEAIADLRQEFLAAGGILHLGQPLDVLTALADSPDVIVVATGSLWAGRIGNQAAQTQGRDALESNEGIRVLTLDDAIDQSVGASAPSIGRNVLIYEGCGTYAPLGLADRLSSRGVRVLIVTPNAAIGAVAAKELELPHVMPRLISRGITMMSDTRILDIAGPVVTLQSTWGGAPSAIAGIDCVVLAHRREPVNALYEAIRASRPRVHCIGDALSPRSTAAVIAEAESLARQLTE